MELAVLELGNAQPGLLLGFAPLLLDLLNLAVHLFVAGDLVEQDIGDFAVLVQEIDDGVPHRRDDGSAHIGVAELVLGLRLEDRILDLDRDRAYHAVANLVGLVVLAGEFVDSLEHPLLECREMGAAVVGVLPVDETETGLAVVVTVGEREFDRFGAVGDDIVEPLLAGLGFEQILKSVGGVVALAVEVERKPAVEIGVHPEPFLDVFELESVVGKELRIGHEADERTVLLRRIAGLLAGQHSAFEARLVEPSVADRAHEKEFREGVDRLRADAVEADGEFEDIVIIFAAGVHHRNTFDHFVERNAAAVVPDGDTAFLNGQFDSPAVAHDELVDAVVDDLLDEDVDAVVGVRTIAHAPDVHTGPEPDVFQRRKGLDRTAVVLYGCFLSHIP